MNERTKPDLSSIQPIGKLPEDEAEAPGADAGRGGRTAADISSARPAVSVEVAALDTSSPGAPSDEERELDKLRRG